LRSCKQARDQGLVEDVLRILSVTGLYENATPATVDLGDVEAPQQP
jgi:hypothetical protein